MKRDEVVVAITGASGAPYAKRLVEYLSQRDYTVNLILSREGRKVLKHELGIGEEYFKGLRGVKIYDYRDFFAPISSGSYLIGVRGVVVLPCSTSTLCCVARGTVRNLIHRVCDVALKEGVKLVMVLREMPLSAIHLECALTLAKLGVVIMPASPGFYTKPKSLNELIDFVVGKTLDSLGIENELYRRWGAT